MRVQADDGPDDGADRLSAERRRRIDDDDPSPESGGFERRGDAGDSRADNADVGGDGTWGGALRSAHDSRSRVSGHWRLVVGGWWLVVGSWYVNQEPLTTNH